LPFNKIQIVGLSGVGKTYLSKFLRDKFGYHHIKLDDIKYVKKFYEKRNLDLRIKILKKEIKYKRFIIDGCWVDLPKKIYKKVDLVIIIKMSLFRILLNIFLRELFGKNKKGSSKGFIENIKLVLMSKFNKVLRNKIENHNDYIMKNSKNFIILKSKLDFKKIEKFIFLDDFDRKVLLLNQNPNFT
jgi:adenylate kinase family enzyme